MKNAVREHVRVKRVQDLLVWQRAERFAEAVSAMIGREPLRNDFPLRNQLNASSISLLSNIAEGFSQKTDRAFAHHLYTARGSNAEARAQLRIAVDRKYISRERFAELDEIGDEIARMLSGLIKHLLREDRKLRY